MTERGLFGGKAAEPRRKRSSCRSKEKDQALLVGPRFLLTVFLTGAVFASVGAWRVDRVFETTDREMETRRLQELAQRQRDRLQALGARVAYLQQGQVLRQTAIDRLGMVDPNPDEVALLKIDEQDLERWRLAAEELKSAQARKEADKASD